MRRRRGASRVVLALAVVLAALAADTAAASRGPSAPRVRAELMTALDVIADAYVVDENGEFLDDQHRYYDENGALIRSVGFGGPPLRYVTTIRDVPRRRRAVYVVDVMSRKGILLLAERDGSGRMHTLFVDVFGDVFLK